MGADGRDAGFDVLGVIGTEAGEDVQGVLPVLAGLLGPAFGVVGVGEAVVGASLIARLGQVGGQLERLLVVDEREVGPAGGVMQAA